MNKSVWNDEINIKDFPKLHGDIKTDVLIIGGGIAGILCALFLENQGVDYILLEGNKICNGTTANTTAKITSQHGLIYNNMLKRFGKEKTKGYLEINETAIKKFKEICDKFNCNYEIKDNYVYTQNQKSKIFDELEALQKIGFAASYSNTSPLPFKIEGAVKFKNSAQFNPLEFISKISNDLKIYENSFVKKVESNKAFTDKGTVTAQKIIFATHFPFINRHGSYFLKMYQHRSYCIALRNAEKLAGMWVDENDYGLSFRNYKDYLILGGGSHRTGKTGGNWQELRKFAKENFENSVEKFHWAAQDCKTLDDIPYIGNYSTLTPNWYVATGFNKWGMTSSMVSAIILSDLVLEKNNDYTDIFSPSRSILRPQLLINGIEAVTNLINLKPKRCPHLGCALNWNKAEHSWDCPCHGSRFNEEGSILENPATKNIRL